MNVYKEFPIFEGEHYLLRGVRLTDAEQLLKVYSDEKAVPLFNGDNCHGDDFRYTTLARMEEAIKFWQFSYDNGYFVRWAVIDKATDTAVGTVELFHRDDEGKVESYDNCGLLRLDLTSKHETEDGITEILTLLKEPTFDLFYCDKIVTKIKPFASSRLAAAKAMGFKPIAEKLIGNDGETYGDYYALRK